MTERDDRQQLDRERSTLADNIERWLELPLVVLAAVWLVLLVVELTHGLSPFLERIGVLIWVIFIAEFALRFLIASQKLQFLSKNWLTLIALVLPAIRVLRVFRIARAIRGVRVVRIISTINRSMNSLGRSMQRRGLMYVIILTLLVLIVGAAGMYAFEKNSEPAVLTSYGSALWWTAMLLTTMGSDYWPQTSEGRVLTLFLSLYALGILGYVAATLSSFFIGREAEESEGSLPGAVDINELRNEIALLRAELKASSNEDAR